jgi:hypothetical protein
MQGGSMHEMWWISMGLKKPIFLATIEDGGKFTTKA